MSSPARHPITDECPSAPDSRVHATEISGAGSGPHADDGNVHKDAKSRIWPDDDGGHRGKSGFIQLSQRNARIELGRFRRWWSGRAAFDVAVCAVYVAFATWIFHGLWADPALRAIAANPDDQALIEWFLAHGVLVWTGDFSLVTDRLNSPDGVNLMSNASHILHGVLMAPVTALFGASVSFALLVTLNLAATAAGWYLLLARGLRLHRGAALIGGAFAGFAPGMIGQSNSHLHMTAQWLVPPIVWCVIRLTRDTTVRATIITATGLGLLVCAQVFLGEEVLFLTALTVAVFAVLYALRHRTWARRVAPQFFGGIAISIAISAILLAYPLWIQFRGSQHTPNAPFRAESYFADLASFGIFSPLSIAGSAEAGRLATSPAEYNTYLGLPLILVVLGCVIWQRRLPVMVPAFVTAIIMTLLSFGPHITLERQRTGWPSLYGLINGLPIISGALPTRYALALIPLLAVILAYAVDASARTNGFARLALPVAVIAALVPTIPRPMATTDRQPVPTFISTGGWRQCAPEGGVIVPVPLPSPRKPDLMRWPAAANVAFGIPEGFFIGPYAAGGRSSLGIYPRPTSRLLTEINDTGNAPAIDDAMRAQARQDLAYWLADCIALAHVPNEPALKSALEQLIGPATKIDDTWTWKITR